MHTFRQWWRGGERAGAAVYRGGWGPAYGTAIIAILLLSINPAFRRYYVEIPLALGLLRSLAERRRAVIFVQESIVFRPPFGAPTTISFSSIRALRADTVRASYLLSPILFKGIRLIMADGSEASFPLNLPGRDAVFSRISAAVASAASGRDASRPRLQR